MRYAEYALFALPLVLAVAWWFGVRGLSRRGLVVSVVGILVFGLGLVWLGEHRAVVGRYVPAQWLGGSVVPAGGSGR